FYPENTVQELNLPEFEDKDVILATGNFCIVENIDQNNEKYSILKITLNDIIRFDTLNSNNLPASPILINMTAMVREDPKIDNEDVVIDVMTRNYIDQDNNNINITCYHLASTHYLTNVTASVQKDSVLYINGELMITDDENIVHIHNVSFPEY
ncbi:26688_t:CDS:2, partial [Dentiscutata erythropus]